MTENIKTYIKLDGEWELSAINEDKNATYKSLAQDLIYSKLHNCTWIKKITEENKFNGFEEITVYFDNGIKSVYTVERC